MKRPALLLLCFTLLGACERFHEPQAADGRAKVRDASEYYNYGGDGGRQYSDAGQITRDNIARLQPAWVYRTGEISHGSEAVPTRTAFEMTPILAEGLLYLCTPYNRVVALDPATGAERWAFDPQIDLSRVYANQLVCRGVSFWRDAQRDPGDTCAARIFTATQGAQLIALDATTGERCADFGTHGQVDTRRGIGKARLDGVHQHTSPPTLIGDTVVLGGSISDGEGTDAPSGVVRGYDARDGSLRWSQDLAPPGIDRESVGTSEAGYVLATPNVWAPMIADEELGLVYAPTGNPLPDYFRNADLDRAHYGSSLVALDGETGKVAWHYQFVHRDYWDFDTPAQPTLFEIRRNGERIPAVAQATKMGFIFILDRRTGESLFPVEERPVPQNPDFPALALSPTQPVPLLPPPVTDMTIEEDELLGLSFLDSFLCRREMDSMRYEGMYTPISDQWTLVYPGNAGGSNWGGIAIDEQRQTLVANATNLAWQARLVARSELADISAANPEGEFLEQLGTEWGLWRRPWLSVLGIPCSPQPWGQITAIDLDSGEHLWQTVLGTTRDLSPLPLGLKTGTPTLGGPLMTASGLIFIGATADNYIRAYDGKSGEELWRGRLPAPAIATPMSYVVRDEQGDEKQFVVIAAGGNGRVPGDLSDALVAYALPD